MPRARSLHRLAPVRRGRGAWRRHGAVGAVERPRAGTTVAREQLKVVGWALFLRSAVSHVDILIDGAVAGRARLGLPRSKDKTPQAAGHPGAAVCGFEWLPDASDLPADRDRIRIGARVTSVAGETFEIAQPEEVVLEPPEPPFDGDTGLAAQLRDRTLRRIGPRRTPARPSGTRVLAFTHRLDHGGAQRYFFEQIRYLMQDPSISCTVVAPRDGVWRRRLETLGAEVHLTPFPVAGITEYESAIAQLAAWAREREFDVAFASTLDTFLGADLASRLGIPLAWKIHESFDIPTWWTAAHGREGHPYVRGRLEQAVARAPAMVFAADATRRQYEPYADPARMITAPYGLELGDIDAFRAELEPERVTRRRAALPEGSTVLLCLGTINARKAQAVLAQAFALVAASHPSAHLALVGDTGDEYSAGIRTFLADAGLEERCTLVPVTSDAYWWHELADVFVLSSDIESSPISILEAMAFETPVVASSVYGVPELIEDGRNGYLCEASNIGDIARALDRALSADPAERARVAAAGAERVRRRHDPLRYARSLRRLLLDLAADPAATPTWVGDEAAPTAATRALAPARFATALAPTEPAPEDGGLSDAPAREWPTVEPQLRRLIRAAARATAATFDAPLLNELLGDPATPDPSLAGRNACLGQLDLTGATVLDVGSVLGELARTARALGAARVDGVLGDPTLVTVASLINAHRHVTRVFFGSSLDELAGAGSRYDVAVVARTVEPAEAMRAVELADRAAVLELGGDPDEAERLARLIAPGFPVIEHLGEVSGVGDPATFLLLGRDRDALAPLRRSRADGEWATAAAPEPSEVARA